MGTLNLEWLNRKKTQSAVKPTNKPAGSNADRYIANFRPKTVLIQTGYENTSIDAEVTTPITAVFTDAVSQKTLNSTDGIYTLNLSVTGHMVANSLSFEWGNKRYFDKDGVLYCDLNPTTNEKTQAGAVNYQTAQAMITVLPDDPNAGFKVISLISHKDDTSVDSLSFIIAQNPVAKGSLSLIATSIDGQTLTAKAQSDGTITGDMTGFVDYLSGFVSLQFGKWVDDDTSYHTKPWYSPNNLKNGQIYKPTPIVVKSLRYNAVAYQYMPVPADVIDIDTVRLPTDGQVPIFRVGDTVLISNTTEQDLGSAFTSGQTIQLDRQNLDRLCLQDSRGRAVNANLWEYDLNAGTITFSDSLDLSSYQLPLIAKLTYEEKNVIISTDIDGTLGLRFATKRDYPKDNTYVSSVLIGKDLQVRSSVPFTQRAWTNVWADTPIGDELLSRLNVKDYPIKLTDDGAITERWVIRFKSSSQFELYGQNLGFVGVFDLLTDLAPINPATNKPYFTIPKQAFGVQNGMSAWATQDVIRFNTWGTLLPFWVIQAVQPTANPFNEEDGFSMGVFGDTTVL